MLQVLARLTLHHRPNQSRQGITYGCHNHNCGLSHSWAVAGKAKEASARSCHQEVLCQSKTALAAAAAAPAAAAAAAEGSASDPTGGSAEPDGVTAGGAEAPAGAAEAAAKPVTVRVCDVLDAPAANGYLSAAELVLQLNLPGLGHRLLELAAGNGEQADTEQSLCSQPASEPPAATDRFRPGPATSCVCHTLRSTQRARQQLTTSVAWPAGLKDPEGLLARRLRLAQARVAVAAGDSQAALSVLWELAEGVPAGGSDEEKGVMQLLLGDATYQVCGGQRPACMRSPGSWS